VTLHVEDLRFQCILGILDFERVTPQDIIVNLTLDYNYKNGFINYADIIQIIKEMMIKEQYLDYKAINALDIKITKPSILPDCNVSVSHHYKSQS